jgi:NAD(P)H-dependent flavin oxidoreductase YrpB (nitropropane dioxygenase family)
MITTDLCDMVGIRYPIVQAGMGPTCTEKLAIASANAGVLGIISTSGFGYLLYPPARRTKGIAALCDSLMDGQGGTWQEEMVRSFERAKEQTRESGGIFGTNVIVAAESAEYARETIRTIIRAREEDAEMGERMRVIITSAGDPVPSAELVKPSGLTWFHVVPSVRHALRAQKAGVDGVIASGQEGGGHVAWEPVHSMVLLPAVVRAVDVPVIGAGGFGNGAALAAALALGAAGVQMGTRFLATVESDFNQVHKDYVIKSNERDTIVARGVVGPLRWIRNEAAMDFARLTVDKAPGVFLGQPSHLDDVDRDLVAREDEGWDAQFKGDGPNALLPGGEVAGLIDSLPHVQDLVGEIMDEAETVVGGMTRFCS